MRPIKGKKYKVLKEGCSLSSIEPTFTQWSDGRKSFSTERKGVSLGIGEIITFEGDFFPDGSDTFPQPNFKTKDFSGYFYPTINVIFIPEDTLEIIEEANADPFDMHNGAIAEFLILNKIRLAQLNHAYLKRQFKVTLTTTLEGTHQDFHWWHTRFYPNYPPFCNNWLNLCRHDAEGWNMTLDGKFLAHWTQPTEDGKQIYSVFEIITE